jgi:hypothetical protein
MDKDELEQSNRSKYGSKQEDVIAHCYSLGDRDGDLWCLMNVRKYVERYSREGSSKANNITDLEKAMDYLKRVVEKSNDPVIAKESYFAALPRTKTAVQNMCINIDAYLSDRSITFLKNVKIILQTLIDNHETGNSEEIIE